MKHKNPIVAGLLNLVFPGLGAAYSREWDRISSEFVVAIPFTIIWMFGAFLVNLLDDPQKLLYFNAGFMTFYAFVMFLDGSQAAQIHNRKTQDF